MMFAHGFVRGGGESTHQWSMIFRRRRRLQFRQLFHTRRFAQTFGSVVQRYLRRRRRRRFFGVGVGVGERRRLLRGRTRFTRGLNGITTGISRGIVIIALLLLLLLRLMRGVVIGIVRMIVLVIVVVVV